MKIKNNVTIYRCEYCNKLYLRKIAAMNHEQYCGSNPATWRDCFECKYLVMQEGETPTNNYYGDEFMLVKFLFCETRKVALYPPKIERKGRPYELLYMEEEEYGNEAMPKVGECKFKKGQLDAKM